MESTFGKIRLPLNQELAKLVSGIATPHLISFTRVCEEIFVVAKSSLATIFPHPLKIESRTFFTQMLRIIHMNAWQDHTLASSLSHFNP
jgi:hypothetical protein